MLELTIRLVVSLAIVIGLLLVLAKVGGKKFRGGTGSMVHVVHRQPLSRTSAVAVVTVGSRVLVLGTTEQQISVLAELDHDEIALEEGDLDGAEVLTLTGVPSLSLLETLESSATTPEPSPIVTVPKPGRTPARSGGSHRAAPGSRSGLRTGPRETGRSGTPAPGALSGSILSVQTWRQALGALRRAS